MVTPVRAASAATTRAYLADLRDIADFWAERGNGAGLAELEARHLFAYLAGLVKAGRSASTVRRRLTALRANVRQNGEPNVSVEALHELEDQILSLAGTQTTAMVVSDDAIVREGLAAVLAKQGVLTWADTTRTALASTGTVWDYVLVWLPSPRGIDRYTSIEWVAEAAETGVPVVTLYPGRVTELFRLRLAEAGARYALPQGWLSQRVEDLPEMLATATLPTRFHLETPLALRQKLGLSLAGRLAPLLAAAVELPEEVWRSPTPDVGPHLSRSQVQRLRRIASEDAGIPPPFGRYSTAMRNAPRTPDWRDVRRVVRQAFNFPA